MTLPATTAILTNPETITTSGASAAFTISPALNETVIAIDVTAVSGTNAECDFYVDESPDGGTTWQPVGIGAPVARAAGVQNVHSPCWGDVGDGAAALGRQWHDAELHGFGDEVPLKRGLIMELFHYGNLGAAGNVIPRGQARWGYDGGSEGFYLSEQANTVEGSIVSTWGTPSGTLTLQTSADGVTWTDTADTETLSSESTTWSLSLTGSSGLTLCRVRWSISGGSFVVTGVAPDLSI